MSERMVDSHVRSSLNKLGVSSCARIAAWMSAWNQRYREVHHFLNTAKIPAVVAAAGLTPLNTGFVPLFRSVALRSATAAKGGAERAVT